MVREAREAYGSSLPGKSSQVETPATYLQAFGHASSSF